MASISPIGITKQPLKFVEIPLNKFSEEVIPHHEQIYQQHKTTIHKLIALNNGNQLTREIKDKKRVIKQLKDLMYELDTLRTQIEDSDLDKFDTKTLSLRKIILTLIHGYNDLEKASNKIFNQQQQNESVENQDPFAGTSQIQLHQTNLDELKVQQRQATLERVQDIHQEVEDLHEMYRNLNEMVHEQGESVINVEENVEDAQQNVERGAQDIKKAHRFSAVAYPATGALLGGIIGGPIGLLAGLKVGGIAAIGCALAGYTGGKFFKKAHDPDNLQLEEDNANNETEVEDQQDKKDI